VIPHIPIHERLTAVITEFALNEYFCDIQKQGPFKSWHHTHYFEARDVDGHEGTVIGDEVEYEIGFGVVGTLLERIIFSRMMAAIFEHRKRALDRVFAAEVGESHSVKA